MRYSNDVACNVMEGFLLGYFFRSTERHFNIQTRLIESQGKIKNLNTAELVCYKERDFTFGRPRPNHQTR